LQLKEATAMRKLILAALLLTVARPVYGGWGGGSCGPVGPMAPALLLPQPFVPAAAPAPAPSGYHWEPTSNPDQVALYLDGIQLGNWYLEDGSYGRLNGDHTFSPASCPADPPPAALARKARPIGQYPAGGVEWDRLGPERYRCRDHEHLSKAQALQLIADVPAFDKRQRLTVVGPAEQTRRVMADLKGPGELSEWAAEKGVLVQCYEPGDWAVRTEAGFDHDGALAIYWQDRPNAQGRGPLLCCCKEYTTPAALVASLRRVDPSFDRNKVPDGKPKPPPDDPNSPAPAVSVPQGVCGGCLAALLAVGAALLLPPKKESQ
jgi:hypothetical protein